MITRLRFDSSGQIKILIYQNMTQIRVVLNSVFITTFIFCSCSKYETDGVQKENIDRECIISFIDDDSGKYIPSVWGPILDSTGIKMGFACITAYLGGAEDPSEETYEQIDIQYLRKLYNEGHDVYSHSNTHPAFYMDSTDVERIKIECSKSKEWIIKNGFDRCSNIIVYPYGLGQQRIEKKAVIKNYYQYGVDATGGGINPEPLDNWAITRCNADTSSLSTLKSIVDEACNTGRLLVFMNHAYELNKDKNHQQQKMLDLIHYIQSKNIEIMPLSEALKHKGNIVADGEFTSFNHHFVSVNGVIKCGREQYMHMFPTFIPQSTRHKILLVVLLMVIVIQTTVIIILKKRKND